MNTVYRGNGIPSVVEGGYKDGESFFGMVQGPGGFKETETMIGNWWLKRHTGRIPFLWILLFLLGLCPFAGAAEGPVIRIGQTIYTFPLAYEGEKLSHTFVVSNRGDAVLHIKKVRPS